LHVTSKTECYGKEKREERKKRKTRGEGWVYIVGGLLA
jgi:hypothetical protein